MTEVKTEPVKAQLLESIDEIRDVPGAFEYYRYQDQYPAGILYCCPCGCGRIGSLHFRHVPKLDSHDTWVWDGNMEKPTLTPSVRHKDHWHGFLTNGVWVSC